jgi:hypothetical protein
VSAIDDKASGVNAARAVGFEGLMDEAIVLRMDAVEMIEAADVIGIFATSCVASVIAC